MYKNVYQPLQTYGKVKEAKESIFIGAKDLERADSVNIWTDAFGLLLYVLYISQF